MSKQYQQIRDEEINETIANLLTEEDVNMWHSGEMTDHVEEIMNQFGLSELQIWGGGDGVEPLSIVVVK